MINGAVCAEENMFEKTISFESNHLRKVKETICLSTLALPSRLSGSGVANREWEHGRKRRGKT